MEEFGKSRQAGFNQRFLNGYLSVLSLREAAINTGKKFVHSSVKRIICNTCYIGDDFYTAIISKQTFERANADMIRRSENHSHKKRLKPPHLYREFAVNDPAMQYEYPVQQTKYIYSLIEMKA